MQALRQRGPVDRYGQGPTRACPRLRRSPGAGADTRARTRRRLLRAARHVAGSHLCHGTPACRRRGRQRAPAGGAGRYRARVRGSPAAAYAVPVLGHDATLGLVLPPGPRLDRVGVRGLPRQARCGLPIPGVRPGHGRSTRADLLPPPPGPNRAAAYGKRAQAVLACVFRRRATRLPRPARDVGIHGVAADGHPDGSGGRGAGARRSGAAARPGPGRAGHARGSARRGTGTAGAGAAGDGGRAAPPPGGAGGGSRTVARGGGGPCGAGGGDLYGRRGRTGRAA